MPWFVSKRALERARSEGYEDASNRATETIKRVRSETALETRRHIMARLSNMPRGIRSRIIDWHDHLSRGLNGTARAWYAKRGAAFVEELKAGQAEASQRVLDLEPQALIQKSIDTHRRSLLEGVSQRAGQALRARTDPHIDHFIAQLQARAKEYRGSLSSGSHALPNGTRFFYETPSNRRIYVMEQSPGMRTIEHRGKSYRLAFPFVVFVAIVDNGSLAGLFPFFRNTRLESVKDEIFAPALPNISQGSVCFHSPGHDNPSKTAEAAVQSFWGSSFNWDYRGYYDRNVNANREIETFDRWERASARDPNFVLAMKWVSTDWNTLEELISQMIGRNEDGGTGYDTTRRLLEEAAGLARQDTLEALTELIGRYKLEDIPAKVLSDHIRGIWQESIGKLEVSFRSAADEIFSQVPDVAPTITEVDQWRQTLLEDAERALEWTGIVPDETHEEREVA